MQINTIPTIIISTIIIIIIIINIIIIIINTDSNIFIIQSSSSALAYTKFLDAYSLDRFTIAFPAKFCDLISEVMKNEEEVASLSRQVKNLTVELREARDDCRRTELELLQELDMLQDKNSVMSNLLDIINERAEAAEEELERRLGSNPGTSASPARAGSNVSQVSALSDTSTGSDEVFVFQYAGGKEGALTRDWEAKLKGRIESLERLLAEERQKVTTAEKKLFLAGIGTITPSVSDDVKLRMREKEILQDELITSQHHLQIATDQIKGLRERLGILEDEHARLKEDYGKLYEEV
ncbi:sporulation-specific protein 15-like isoform X2 [Elysia marginata]|uniref:Sporulation-specific protein 15-like isoform X2 n=1 Tax=Elysia marginata TaxID=1093978 RepID=A0AAV4JDC2_9GAST|nr:sporulation-specific protein 15-like isoform X2 [Elysia marginata]